MQATIERAQTPPEQAQKALNEAREQLTRLEEELTGMPDLLRSAADGGDLLKLRQRQNELTAHRDFGRITVARHEVLLLDAQISEQAVLAKTAGEAVGKAQARYEEVRQLQEEVANQHRQALGALQSAQIQQQSLRTDKGEKQRALASLTSEAVH